MSDTQPSRVIRPRDVVLGAIVAAVVAVYVVVVVTQVVNGTVFWPSVFASLFVALSVGVGAWLVRREQRTLDSDDAQSGVQYRQLARRWSVVLAAAGLVTIGAVLFALSR
jgi:uncharacterized protein (DUF2062 family)